MAKTPQFQAYDRDRKKLHLIPEPPVKINACRLNVDEWRRVAEIKTASKPSKVQRKRKTKESTKKRSPRTVADVLRCRSEETVCLHCGRITSDRDCGRKCYTAFREAHFVGNQIEIKGPSHLGYGAYTKPGVHIRKGQWLDEYIGDLRPLDVNIKSPYRFEIPKTCAIDAEKAGNWTRFINSHCQPNVKPYGDVIGGRQVVLFQALRDIGPETEIVFNYEKGYFEHAGIKCSCNAYRRPHVPKGAGSV